MSPKDSNYILAILDSRMKFVAHERFQYVMLKKFGKNKKKKISGLKNFANINTTIIYLRWSFRKKKMR